MIAGDSLIVDGMECISIAELFNLMELYNNPDWQVVSNEVKCKELFKITLFL